MNQRDSIQGELYREMMYSGATLLERNAALVDSLNVFPVPDGDTGSNMSMTMNAAIRELRSAPGTNIGELSQVVARGALRGARGNSGVILSQLLRGMAKAFENADSIDAPLLAAALKSGADAAYKAVMKPKEGTILTVARVVAEKAVAEAANGSSIDKLVYNMAKNGEAILAKTPELLPVLKEAGVVDSGGKGLLFIYQGFQMALDGESIDDFEQTQDEALASAHDNNDIMLAESTDEIVYGYCTEFFIEHLLPHVTQSDINALHDHLQRMGDSVVAVSDDDLVKIHVHTNAPGKALQMALQLGEINGVKIENMREQHRHLMAERTAQRKAMGIAAVSTGAGLGTLFKDGGVDALIMGGQSMNPSALELEKAVRRVNATTVFLLPNNKNIQLAAEQAAELLQAEGKQDVRIIPSVSIQQGIAAMQAFDPTADADQNEQQMKGALKDVRSGSITTAVRDTTVDGLDIRKGDYIGILNGDIVVSSASMDEALHSLEAQMIDDDTEYITVFFGEGIDAEQAAAVAAHIEETHPGADVVVQNGGQPLYPYLLSAE